MAYQVVLSEDAERDIEETYYYVAVNDAPSTADVLLSGLEQACFTLADMPERGNVPKELQHIGITEYREAHYKPYRILYRVTGKRVVVYAVLDGRRDMQTLLLERLTRQ